MSKRDTILILIAHHYRVHPHPPHHRRHPHVHDVDGYYMDQSATESARVSHHVLATVPWPVSATNTETVWMVFSTNTDTDTQKSSKVIQFLS